MSERIPGERELAHAHNLWLNWFLEAGVLGLLAILLLTGMALWIALRGARAGSATAGGGLAALVGFFLLS
ncbi:MAG: O-antigen ligase domain-containing protein, partial [Actinomycetota bacterium]|nr:O-antigen ligase domain-containing protein [Actinomycetota bacterium]